MKFKTDPRGLFTGINLQRFLKTLQSKYIHRSWTLDKVSFVFMHCQASKKLSKNKDPDSSL